jgi:hypothetical protein
MVEISGIVIEIFALAGGGGLWGEVGGGGGSASGVTSRFNRNLDQLLLWPDD